MSNPIDRRSFLIQAGVAGIYGPGTVIPVAAQKIMTILTGSLVGG